LEVRCINCDATFEVEDVVVGELLDCPDCGITLKVVKIKGDEIELSIAAEEEEDWGE